VDEEKTWQPKLHKVMLSTVGTAVMEVGMDMYILFLHQGKYTGF